MVDVFDGIPTAGHGVLTKRFDLGRGVLLGRRDVAEASSAVRNASHGPFPRPFRLPL